MKEFEAGYAEVDFTPEPGLALRGQQRKRIATHMRDPLMANAVAYRWGGECVVLVSVDICFLGDDIVTRVQRTFEDRTGIPGRRLLPHATHSHVAPVTISHYWGEADPAFLDKLHDSIVKAALTAIENLKPVTVFSGAGELEHLGWNRRAMFADGASVMHGSPSRPDFIGSEGPRDPVLSVLFTRDGNSRITGAIVSFSTHPNSVENECYYSADIPGEIRRLLKLWLGHKVVVVYLTGAAGNTTPRILESLTPEQPWMGEEGLWRSGMYMAGEAAKVVASTVHPIEDPELRIEQTALRVPIRPFPKPGERNYPSFWSKESEEYYKEHEANWPDRIKKKSPAEVRLSVIRIGDTAICTNPAELFAEFGLQIREASPARVTIIGELTDGYVGYIPTPLAFSRGGYETWAAPTSQLVPEAGGLIVQATADMLRKAFYQN